MYPDPIRSAKRVGSEPLWIHPKQLRSSSKAAPNQMRRQGGSGLFIFLHPQVRFMTPSLEWRLWGLASEEDHRRIVRLSAAPDPGTRTQRQTRRRWAIVDGLRIINVEGFEHAKRE